MNKSSNEMKSKKIFAGILIVSIVIIIGLSFSYYKTLTISERLIASLNALSQAKFEIASAHLWFEEKISGDKYITDEDIFTKLRKAKNYIDYLKYGGSDGVYEYSSIEEGFISKKIDSLKNLIIIFEEITRERMASPEDAGIGSDIDQKYDKIFNHSNLISEQVERDLTNFINDNLSDFKITQIAVIIGIILSSILILAYFSIYLKEKEKTEKELLESKLKAEEADNLKSAFLAQMSHEIRTPINSILSFTSLMKEEFQNKVNDDMKEGFSIIDSGSRRLIRTIDSIMNLSRLQIGEYESTFKKISVNQVLDSIINEFQYNQKSNTVKLIYENQLNEVKIYCDEYSLNQMLINLIDNALKYTNEGHVKVKLYEDDGNIIIEIEDSGIGIEKTFLTKIFEPFSQEDTGYTRKYEGAGLGLSLVKKYCEINNAFIKVNSEKNIGSKFTICFNSENVIKS